jgi:IS30 family transposase
MNELTPAQRERILARLREGRSLRQIQSETGHRRETIARYGRRAGLLPEPRRASAADPRRGGSQSRAGRGAAHRARRVPRGQPARFARSIKNE